MLQQIVFLQNQMEKNMSKHFPVLETNRFILRQFTEDDLGYLFSGLSNPEVVKYYGIRFDSPEATRKQLEWFKKQEKRNRGIWWAICSKDTGTFYGAGGLNDKDKKNHRAETGFWLLPQYWGSGIMTEVLPVICDYGFKKLHLHRIVGYVESENRNCKNALARMDFKYEGTMEECEFRDGKYISIDIYAMIKKENESEKHSK
jgi:[ribosomal protein S5]-alanine N-acetyltransferase